MRNFKLWFDRALSHGIGRQLGIMGGILLLCYGVSSLLLSCSDTLCAFCAEHGIPRHLLPFYMLIDSNTFGAIQFNRSSTVDLWILIGSGISYLLGLVFFSGAIIAILSDFISRRVENYENGHTYYFRKGHYVILGYDAIVPSVISSIICEQEDAHIVVLASSPAQEIYEQLRESVARTAMQQIVVNYGHRVSRDYYEDIHLADAEQIYIVGDRRKDDHDAVNVECMENICTFLKEQQDRLHRACPVKRITCVFEDADTYTAFRTTDIFSDIMNDLDIEFVPYNFNVSWARRVFVKRSYIGKADGQEHAYPCLYGKGIGLDDPHYVHIVFVGMSNPAVTFATEAAHMFHFPNFQKAKTRITFIDRKADEQMPLFITRHHHFFEIQPYFYGDYSEEGDKQIRKDTSRVRFEGKDADFLDIDFEFIKGDVFSEAVQDLLYTWAKDEHQYLSVFLAMANQRDNFAIAMNMPDAVYNLEIPVFVRQDSSDNFITLLRQADEKAPRNGKPEYVRYEHGVLVTKEAHGRYAHIYPFGMKDTSFFVDNTALERAKRINYLYQTMQDGHFLPLAELEAKPADTIREEAAAYWKQLTVAEQWSNIYFAYSIDFKLHAFQAMRAAGTDEKRQMAAMGESEHHHWNVEKLLMGYRKPKPAEDLYHQPEEIAQRLKNNKHLFIHAQIRPYDELTEPMKQLDIEFIQYILWIISLHKSATAPL